MGELKHSSSGIECKKKSDIWVKYSDISEKIKYSCYWVQIPWFLGANAMGFLTDSILLFPNTVVIAAKTVYLKAKKIVYSATILVFRTNTGVFVGKTWVFVGNKVLLQGK